MTDLDDEKKIKEYMAAKMKHIKMYNECMNLADGLDVAKFAELVRADEREACLKEIAIELDEWNYGTNANIALNNVYAAIRARGEK